MINMFAYDFFIRALIAGGLVGFIGSFYGVFIVQRKMSFLGNGLAHAAFGGVALGMLLNAEPLYVAIPFTILVSILINYVKDKTQLSSDTSIGILFSVSVALGSIFIALKSGYSSDAFAYLFGSILSVSKSDIYISIFLAILTIISFYKYWAYWAYSSFDEDLAIADKIPVKKYDYILSILMSLSIVVSIKIVGMLLISAFLVVPAATARLTSKSFFQMTIYSIIIGILTSFGGLALSVALDLPSGAVIIILQASLFMLFYLIFKKR